MWCRPTEGVRRGYEIGYTDEETKKKEEGLYGWEKGEREAAKLLDHLRERGQARGSRRGGARDG